MTSTAFHVTPSSLIGSFRELRRINCVTNLNFRFRVLKDFDRLKSFTGISSSYDVRKKVISGKNRHGNGQLAALYGKNLDFLCFSLFLSYGSGVIPENGRFLGQNFGKIMHQRRIYGRTGEFRTAVVCTAGPQTGEFWTAAGESTNEEVPGIILGIETSCDDTGVAVVTTDGKILGEALASQGETHSKFGGVVPYLAQGEHEKNIHSVVNKALEEAKISEKDLSAVAVTIGPGLSLCLQVGVRKAREIAKKNQISFIGVHHMEAHALVARLTEKKVAFPFVTLLISGGHNLLLLAHGVGRYTQLGASLDDAVGEAYDKTARLLGLDLTKGGGPALEELAREGDPKRYLFKVPMKGVKNCEFSYAGLKSSVRLTIEREIPHAEKELIENVSKENRQMRADIAASFQRVAVLHLEDRTRRALQWALEREPLVKHLVVAGGVASNRVVRTQLEKVAEETKIELLCPPPRLCTDNGVMVAWAGVERFNLGLMESPPPFDEPDDAWVDVRPRWPLGETLEGSQPLKSSKKRDVFPSLTSLSSFQPSNS